ncbi:MAG: ABC transporter permease, partial [Candidatus Heimdallarchaeota archaeon]
MSLENLIYKIRNKLNVQFIKLTWVNIKRDKAKAIFAILGILISLTLLTAIGMVNDTMSFNYMQLITSSTGNADIMITRSVQTDLTYNPFFDESLIESNLTNIEGVEELFPRIMMLTRVSSDNINENATLELYGIDFNKEANNGHIGNLNLVDENGIETGEIYIDEPANGECVILWKVAELLNVSIGDLLYLEYQQYSIDLEVIAICKQDLKFSEFENALIITNLQQVQSFLQKNNQVNFIIGTVTNPELIYDVRDFKTTERKLREIGTRIQQRLDPNEYSVSMPKLEELSAEEFLLVAMTVIFWFITIIAMLITGILINSILSTSTEERVREYGIIRVVGGKRTFPIKMVIFEGFVIGVIGSIGGIIIGLLFTPPVVDFLFVMTGFVLQDMTYVIQPFTVIITFLIGSITSLVISLFPALKTAKIDIIKSITPFHQKEEGWEVKKEESMNVKSFLIGISIATIGMIVFVLLPNIFVTGEFMLVASLFIGLLAAILIGLVFASVGVIPLIQGIFLGIITPAIRKYAHIIKISLKRNRRRNTSTIVMFAISFSFIFFITSVTEMESKNMSLNLRFQYGSDLVIINQGLDADSNAVTLDMVNEIESYTGIESLSITLYNMFDITSVLAIAFDFSEGSAFDEETINQAFMNIFEFYSEQAETKYQVEAALVPGYDDLEVGFIGIDKNFYEVMDNDLFIWSSPNSGTNYSFTELFEYNNTCIIAKSLANVLGISDIDENVYLTFYNPQVSSDPGNVTLFRVVGICGGMPGFYNFKSSEVTASGGGVMVSMENYIRLMDVENANDPNMIVDKIFISLIDKSEGNIEQTKEEISTNYEDKDYFIDDAISKINFLDDMYKRQSTLMEIINWFAIAIAIFGLVSSMYAIMLERKFEIGILRSLGMKTRNVRNLFLIESLIILLSSGTMGTIIGTYCAYLMETNLGLIMELPITFAIPVDVLLRVFIIS